MRACQQDHASKQHNCRMGSTQDNRSTWYHEIGCPQVSKLCAECSKAPLAHFSRQTNQTGN